LGLRGIVVSIVEALGGQLALEEVACGELVATLGRGRAIGIVSEDAAIRQHCGQIFVTLGERALVHTLGPGLADTCGGAWNEATCRRDAQWTSIDGWSIAWRRGSCS
jgi:hypothetical protein